MQADYINAGGVRVFVRRWGDADAPGVLYWHGGGGGTDEWPRIAPVLVEAGYSVYGPEAPGYGRSPPLEPEAYFSSNVAELAVALIDELAIAPVVWIRVFVGCEHRSPRGGAVPGARVRPRAPRRRLSRAVRRP